MAVEPYVFAEEPGCLRHEVAIGRQFAQGLIHLEGRVELKDRVRPQRPFGEHALDVFVDSWVQDPDEALNIVPVLKDYRFSKPKYI